jgi:molybdenum cofactor synthesis domain-containing protein
MGKITAICMSEKRGTAKKNVESASLIAAWGLEGDAHAGDWHRQVSLISSEKIAEFNAKGADVSPGAFGENIIIEGLDPRALPVGTRLRSGGALLEITQIGKECHSHCEIYHRMGDCIMPREGVFAKVLESGRVSVGDGIAVEARGAPVPWRAAVITLSDKASRGEREDKSGPAITARLVENGYAVVRELLLPDDRVKIEAALIDLCDRMRPDVILTTGGTGFSPRDVTPEATLAIAGRRADGIAEAIRAASMKITPRAMLSRGVAAIRGNTLIINLPGSPKACMEGMDVFLETLPHGLELLRGEAISCAR